MKTIASQPALQQHLGLAVWFAQVMCRRIAYLRKLDRDEVIAQALIGLARTLATYDPSRGSLSAYAWRYVRSEMDHFLRHRGPVSVSTDAIRNASDIPLERQKLAKAALTSSTTSNPDRLPDQRPSATQTVEDTELLAYALAGLSPRERQVIHLRYVEGLTCREIASQLGISHQLVSRIENEALAVMRIRLEVSR